MPISLGVLLVFQRGECNGEKGSSFLLLADQYREMGRYIFLYCSIENRMYVLANVYIPPPFKLEVMYSLMEFMLECLIK